MLITDLACNLSLETKVQKEGHIIQQLETKVQKEGHTIQQLETKCRREVT